MQRCKLIGLGPKPTVSTAPWALPPYLSVLHRHCFWSLSAPVLRLLIVLVHGLIRYMAGSTLHDHWMVHKDETDSHSHPSWLVVAANSDDIGTSSYTTRPVSREGPPMFKTIAQSSNATG